MSDEVVTDAPAEEPTSTDQPSSTVAEPTSAASATDDPGPTPGSEAQPATDANADPPEWLKLAQQYKGDKGAIAKAYSEKLRYATQLADEKKKLEAELGKLRSRPPVAPGPPKESQAAASLKRIDDRIKAFESKVNNHKTDRDAALKKYNEALVEISVTQRLLGKADEVDKPEFQRQLEEWTRLKDLEAWKYSQADGALETIEFERERLGLEKTNAEQAIADEKARQEQADAEDEEFRENFPRQMDASFDRFANDAKIPEDEKTRDYAWRVCRALQCQDLWRLGMAGTAKEADHDAMLKAYVDEFAQFSAGLSAGAFNKESTDKLNVATNTLTQQRIAAATGAPRTPAPANGKGNEDWKLSPANLAARDRLAKLGW